MARFATTCETERAPEAIFDLLADMRNASRWDPGVAEARVSGSEASGEVGLGTTFDVTLRLGGRLKHVTYQLSRYERPLRVMLSAEEPAFRSTDTIEVEALTNSKALVTYSAELQPKGLWRAATPLLALSFRRIAERAARGLAAELSP